MKNIEAEINGKIYELYVVEDQEEAYQGLRGIDDIDENEGMLFSFDKLEEQTFTMDGMLIPIDIIGLDENDEIISIKHAKPGDTDIKIKAQTVIELHVDSDVEIGDNVYFDLDEEDKENMLVLDEDGDVQMELEGGERIFSRKSTRRLILLAKRANKEKRNKIKYRKACIALGKYIFKELDQQDSRQTETVSLPE